MKISEILNRVNTFEKNHFLRLIEQIINDNPKNYKKIEKILYQIDGQIKNADNLSVEEIFNLIQEEYKACIIKEFSKATTQLDILVDIIIRDGNSIMSREWLLILYEKEIKKIKSKSKILLESIERNEDQQRIKDYKLYRNCVKTAYHNDLENNLEEKVTSDEQSILNTVVEELKTYPFSYSG